MIEYIKKSYRRRFADKPNSVKFWFFLSVIAHIFVSVKYLDFYYAYLPTQLVLSVVYLFFAIIVMVEEDDAIDGSELFQFHILLPMMILVSALVIGGLVYIFTEPFKFIGDKFKEFNVWLDSIEIKNE
jgi:hypothetical protein